MILKPYPCCLCFDCGNKYGRHCTGVSTVQKEKCKVCGKVKDVTQPRDFGYPRIPGFEKP